MKTSALLFSLPVLCLVGCNRSTPNEVTLNKPQPPQESSSAQNPTPPNSAEANKASPLSLVGTWNISCSTSSSSDSYSATMDITEDKVSMIRYVFLAPDCPAGQEAVNNRRTAQYMTGDSVTLPALATNTTGPSQPDPASTVSIEAKKFDYISQKEFLTPVSESGVNFLSFLFKTGKSWVVNEEQDVTDTLYQLVTGQSSGKAPERMYSIFSLNGDTLCLGTSGQTTDDGTTEAQRHTKLDAGTKCFKRKL